METHLHIRISREWLWKPPSLGCTPDLWSQSLWHGARRAASLRKLPGASRSQSRVGSTRRVAFLLFDLIPSLRGSEHLWPGGTLWFGRRWVLGMRAVIMGLGKRLPAQVLSVSAHTAPSSKHLSSIYLYALSNPALLLSSISTYLDILIWYIRWGENKRGVSLKELSPFVPILTVSHTIQHNSSGGALSVCPRSLSQELFLRGKSYHLLLSFLQETESWDSATEVSQVHPREPKSKLLFVRATCRQALEFWLEVALVVSAHFVLCPIAYFIFIRHLVKETLWGKVSCEIHVYGNDSWICFAGYKYFFLFKVVFGLNVRFT